MQINFFSEETDFKLRDEKLISQWISSTIVQENKIPGTISVIFCTDSFLKEINIKYLNHDTLTDIITFDYVEDNTISGDIFISIDRVQENASSINVSFSDELDRVIIHGILHLLKYNDKTPDEQQLIRAKEDFYLALRTR